MAEAAGKVYPVHNNEFKFGTKGMTSADEDMVVPADLENFAPSIDGTVRLSGSSAVTRCLRDGSSRCCISCGSR